MMVALSDLSKHTFALSHIFAFTRTPSYTVLEVKDRLKNSLIYVQNGSCRYDFDGRSFALGAGAVAYVPRASYHTLTVTDAAFSFVQVDFTVQIDGEFVCFSDRPLKLTDCLDAVGLEMLDNLCDASWRGDYRLHSMAALCNLFSRLCEHPDDTLPQRLLPAMDRLHNRLSARITCMDLARSCYLGQSQFYNLFVSHFGCTPLAYRDSLLLKKAEKLLKTGEIPVCEVADMLGFDSSAYFCRFFKKKAGVTPTAYQKQVHTVV